MINFDLTQYACKKAFAAGEIAFIQANPTNMGIIFLTKKGGKGHVVTRSYGPVRRYKSNSDREHAINIIKGN